MHKIKIKISSEDQSVILQKYLFSVGYRWGDNGKLGDNIMNTHTPYLVIRPHEHTIFYSRNHDTDKECIIDYNSFIKYTIISNIL